MRIIVLYGPPAVGKWTTAQCLSYKTGYRVFHNHLITDMVSSILDQDSSVYKNIWRKTWIEMLKVVLLENINVLVTYCYNPQRDGKFITDLIEDATKSGNKIQFVKLNCEIPELYRRVTGVSRLKFNKSHTIEQLQTVLSKIDFFTDIPDLPHLKINTTHLLPDDVAEIILKHYEVDKLDNQNLIGTHVEL